MRAIREAALARPVVVDEEEGEEQEEDEDDERRRQQRTRAPSSPSPSRFPLPPRGHPCERVFQAEYCMLSLLSASSLPIITLIDGIQMGLGAGLSLAALCSSKGRGVAVAVSSSEEKRTVWAMPEGKIGLFPDVGFLAAGPGLAKKVAANAEEATAKVSPSSSTSSSSPSSSVLPDNDKKYLLFSAEAALLFGLTGARIEGGEALVAGGLASFSVGEKEEEEGSAAALLDKLSCADLSSGGDAAGALFAVAASTAAAAAKAKASSSIAPNSSLLLLEAAAEGGSLRASLRRALDYRSSPSSSSSSSSSSESEKNNSDNDNKELSRALLALRKEWESLSAGGCEAAASALEAWIGKERKEGTTSSASCPLSSALTLRLASDADREEKKASSSSVWSSDPAAALKRQLSREFWPAARLAVSSAFAEGVRATLVEKGKGGPPNWPSYCSSLERIEDSDIDALITAADSSSEVGLDVEGYLARGCLLD